MRSSVSSSDQYLRLAKIEEVAQDLKSQGYRVTVEPGGRDRGYDVVARKGKQTLAVEVKSPSLLKKSHRQVLRLRDAAEKQGYDFRLIVVNPPHRIDVEVADFEVALAEYITNSRPEKLAELPGVARLESVADVEFDSVQVKGDSIQLTGSGVLEVETELGGGEKHDGVAFSNAYPFGFDVTLGSDRRIRAGEITVDDSSFYE